MKTRSESWLAQALSLELELTLVKRMLCLVFLITVLPGSASAQTSGDPDGPLRANFEQLKAGTDAAVADDCESALSILSAAANEDVFVRHTKAIRANVLLNLAVCAYKLQQHERSVPYFEAALDLGDEHAPEILQDLLWLGIHLQRLDISVKAVVRLAEDYPSELGKMEIRKLSELHGHLNGRDVSGELKFTFLRALHDNDYTPEHPFYTTDFFDIDYAIMLANRGETAAIKEIVSGITNPGLLVQVLVDRRFDVISQDPSMADFLDLTGAAEREIDRVGRLVKQHPEYAVGAVYHSLAFTAAWRFEDSLAAIERVSSKIWVPVNIFGYVDLDEAKPWVMAEHSAALWRLDYAEQSGAMYIEALEPPKVKGQNISQIINILPRGLYGGFLEETHAVARQIDLSDASPYGQMWVHAAIVCVNVMGPRISDYTESESFLLEHERDNPAALTLSLLCKNDINSAAEQMVRRVEDPELRMSALLSMQYTGSDWEKERLQHRHDVTDDLTPGHKLWHRYDELRNREDVLRAVNRVGRLIVVPIHHSVWHRY